MVSLSVLGRKCTTDSLCRGLFWRHQKRIDKIETFNDKGELVDLKNYDSAGKYAKDWFQYKYDTDGNLIEEVEYDSKENFKKRTLYKYSNGLEISKEEFDEKGRLSKQTTYEYQYKK